MYTLENAELSIDILDPETDLARCGSRYCVGGYIYQVTDASHGPLLAGPQYPDPFPNVFDGQGAPDMFVTTLGGEEAPVGGEVGVIGVGRVRRTSPIEPFQVRHNPEVIEFLPWTVERTAKSITMRTEQHVQNWAYRLERMVTLAGRALISRTTIHNQGTAPLPVRWFPHPFFPPTPDGVQCRFSIPISLPENPGYLLDAENFIYLNPDFDWQKGCFLALEHEAVNDSLTVEQRHPSVGIVTTVVDYAPAYLPIWGNANTFSFEPYLQTQLNDSQSATWRIEYRF
jgi:hypothetical protein